MSRLRIGRAVGVAGALVVLVAVVGALAWSGLALRDARAETADLGRQVAEREARIDELRAQVRHSEERLGEGQRHVAQLETALGASGPFVDRYAEMTGDYMRLQAAYDELHAELSSLVRIRTPELAGDALLLDRSVKSLTYGNAVCSGSMEPNITCNDLLLLYKPSVSDLRPGDIIYFRRQNSSCTGAMEDRYMLHRITRVTAGSDGLRFHTRGDALSVPDACPVPADDVLYKLLTNVRNARIER